jgi:hypothetical protein
MKPILWEAIHCSSFLVIPGCALAGDSRAEHIPESMAPAVVMDS